MTVTVNDVIKQLCVMGISDIKVSWNEEKGMLCYDLNTQAKSHLYLYEDFSLEGRYNYSAKLDPEESLDFIIRCLFRIFIDCLCGRDFYSHEWMELGVKLGLVEKKVTTHTTTEYI